MSTERTPPVVQVAAAIIRDDAGRYLIAQRLPGTHLGGLWEFPGGKCEPGETLEACLAREIREELGAEVEVGPLEHTVPWAYPEKTVVLHFFHCRLVAGPVQARHDQAVRWVEPGRLADHEFPAADAALVARLRAT